MAEPARVRDRLVWESASFHVHHHVEEDGSSYLGALLIQTKRHAPGLAELSDAEAQELGRLIHRTSRALKSCTTAAWTYVHGFTEAYRHVHVFVAARYPNTPKAYVRLAVAEWPGAPKGDHHDVIELARRLRESMLAMEDGEATSR